MDTARKAVISYQRGQREWRKAMKPAFDALNAEMREVERAAKATRARFFDPTYLAKRDAIQAVARRIESGRPKLESAPPLPHHNRSQAVG